MKIAVIGAGAAGFFGAIHAANQNPAAEITIYEKTGHILSKVLISGGGRCNVTHACFENSILIQNYPRGQKELRSAFEQFTTSDTIKWFETRDVKLKTEQDGRMFPITDDSQTIADCLIQAATISGIKIKLHQGIQNISKTEKGFDLVFQNGQTKKYDRVLIAAGGGPKLSFFNWLSDLDLKIITPVPSLFTFNITDKTIHDMAGISVADAKITVQNSKLMQRGPLLLTHWGLSGPAILKLSAWGARVLSDLNYTFTIHIAWVPDMNEEAMRQHVQSIKAEHHKKQTGSFSPFGFPGRLWKWILNKSEIPDDLRWADVSNKQINKLNLNLIQMPLPVTGKSTFKDEFVTAGGISLSEINLKTMESKKHKGLFFAGEILDIDGVTGGFNFQAAWTSGYIAGKNIGMVDQE